MNTFFRCSPAFSALGVFFLGLSALSFAPPSLDASTFTSPRTDCLFTAPSCNGTCHRVVRRVCNPARLGEAGPIIFCYCSI